MSEEMPVRAQILTKALAATLVDRDESYGDPKTRLDCVSEFRAVYRKYVGDKYAPSHDAAIDSVFDKLSRITCGRAGHTDNYIDGAAYLAIAAECQVAREEEIVAENIAAMQSTFPLEPPIKDLELSKIEIRKMTSNDLDKLISGISDENRAPVIERIAAALDVMNITEGCYVMLKNAGSVLEVKELRHNGETGKFFGIDGNGHGHVFSFLDVEKVIE